MTKQTSSTKLSPEEVQAQLFDGLMLQIEPDLALCNRAATTAKLAALSTEEQEKWAEHYKEAFALFMENWPQYLGAAMQGVETVTSTIRGAIVTQEQETLTRLERKIDTSDDAS